MIFICLTKLLDVREHIFQQLQVEFSPFCSHSTPVGLSEGIIVNCSELTRLIFLLEIAVRVFRRDP